MDTSFANKALAAEYLPGDGAALGGDVRLASWDMGT